MKAWDILKEKTFNIDLVLTEVELPLMSGFLLLSTIMEHDASKNIPVISMR
jgi:pseudo-response regulator 5